MTVYNQEKECPVPEPFMAHLGSILLMTALFFLTFLGRFILAPLMPTIVQELNLTSGQAGSVFLMISIGFFIGQVGSGFLSSWINHRGSLLASILALGLALVFFKIPAGFWFVRCLLFTLGLAAGLHVPSAIATITAMVNRQDWGKAMAVHQSAPSLSLTMGPLIVLLLEPRCSWQTILAIIGGVSVAAGLIFYRFGRFGFFPGEAPRPALVKTVCTRRSFWIMIVLFAFAMGGNVGIYAMLPLYLVGERGFDTQWANSVLSLSRISGIPLVFLAGWLTDRLGVKRFVFIVMFFSGAATVLLGATSGVWLVVMIFIQSAVIGCYFPAGFAALGRIVQPNLRSVVAALTTPAAFLFGGGVLPAAIGYMGQKYSIAAAFVWIGCLIIPVAGLVFFVELIEIYEEGC